MNEKIKAFEYIISLLVDWLMELTDVDEETALKEFNKLKLFKLHFFVSAINTGPNHGNNDLLNTFNAFWALPYGPVESDIYDNLPLLQIFSISNQGISKKNNDTNQYFTSLDAFRNTIGNAVSAPRRENNEIVTYSAFELVELSHQWPVWSVLYDQALKQGRKSIPMPTPLIRASSKKFK